MAPGEGVGVHDVGGVVQAGTGHHRTLHVPAYGVEKNGENCVTFDFWNKMQEKTNEWVLKSAELLEGEHRSCRSMSKNRLFIDLLLITRNGGR